MKRIIVFLMIINNLNVFIYANELQDSIIISFSKELFRISDSNISEKESDSIINLNLYKSFEYFQSDKNKCIDHEIDILFDLIYNNCYSLYTDSQESTRVNKRLISCWISLALIVDDDRKYTFLGYTELHISRMKNPINEKLAIMLIELLLTRKDKLDVTDMLINIRQYIEVHKMEILSKYVTSIIQIMDE